MYIKISDIVWDSNDLDLPTQCMAFISDTGNMQNKIKEYLSETCNVKCFVWEPIDDEDFYTYADKDFLDFLNDLDDCYPECAMDTPFNHPN